MDELEEIRSRKEKRNVELDKMMSDDEGKEKENTANEMHHTVIRHSFKKTPKVTVISSNQDSPAAVPPPMASVKSLRSRWEFSSVTGTPLHPDNRDDEIFMAAVKLSQQRKKPNSCSSTLATKSPSSCLETPVRRFVKEDLLTTNSASQRDFEINSTNEFKQSTPVIAQSTSHFATKSPSMQTESPQAKSRTISLSTEMGSPQKSIETTSSPIQHSPTRDQTTESSPLRSNELRDQPSPLLLASTTSVLTFTESTNMDSNFRPVTPTDQIIGSLWDDINTELEKYKQSKQYQSDPNLSPRSRYGSSTTDLGHSISSYRSQSAKRMGQPSPIKELRTTSTFSSSLDTTLPEKRQRGETSMEVDNEVESKSQIDVTDGQSVSAHHPSPSVHNTTADQEAVLKRLHDIIIVQQDQICQASRALAFCRQNDRFRGSREEVDAQRALLISTERRRALLLERDRVINGRYLSSGNDLKGTLTISALSVMLSRDYINNFVQHPTASNRYYFIVLIKCGEHVFHTTLASSDQGIKSGFIEFSHYISIADLTPDFVCEIEVHSLKSTQESAGTERSARSKKGTWRRMVISTPLNAYSNTFSAYSSSSAHRPIGVMDPGFQRVGHLTLTRQTVNRQKFLLTDSTYPLEGSVLLNVDCHPDPNSLQLREYRSFLSLYQIVSGMGSWTRFWCSLGGDQLRFWRYPEDEANKNPCVALDLAKCVSPVSALAPSSASFPNSMQVDVVMVDERTNQKEGICMLFAADTPEERDRWMDCINQAIRKSNVWRTMKRK